MGALLVCVACVICVLGQPNQCNSRPTEAGIIRVAAEPSLEYKLATIDFGYVKDSDPRIARFRSLLTQLDNQYVERREEIANQTVKAAKMLLDEGIDESMLRMMEGLNQILVQPVPNQRYAEYAAIYVTLRKQGQSHDQTISGMRTLLKAMMGR